jgi:hypothetical protein
MQLSKKLFFAMNERTEALVYQIACIHFPNITSAQIGASDRMPVPDFDVTKH